MNVWEDLLAPLVDLSAQCDRDKRCCRVCTSSVGTIRKLCCREKERSRIGHTECTELMPLCRRRSQLDKIRKNHVDIQDNTVSSTILDDTARSGYHYNNILLHNCNSLSEGLSAPLVDLSAQCDRCKRCCRVCTSPVGTIRKLCCGNKKRFCFCHT